MGGNEASEERAHAKMHTLNFTHISSCHVLVFSTITSLFICCMLFSIFIRHDMYQAPVQFRVLSSKKHLPRTAPR